MKQRDLTAGLTMLAILMVAGIVHIVSVLALPQVAPDDAFARVAAWAPDGMVRVLPRAGAPDDPLPGRDPSVVTAVCRYDLDRGPLRVSAALGVGLFVALSLHGRTGVAFYGLTDRAADDGKLALVVMTPEQIAAAVERDATEGPVRDVRVVAPERRGFVSFDVLPRVGGYPQAARDLPSISCNVEHPL